MRALRLRSTVLCCALALLSSACAPQAPEPVEAPPIPDVSLEDFSGAAAEQVRTALAALRVAPEDAARNGELAMLMDAYGRTGAAVALYERARAFEPAALRWRYYLGSARLKQGDAERAIEAFRAAVAADPGFSPGKRALADALFSANQLGESRKLYEEVLEREPDDPRALHGLGRVLLAQSEPEAAIAKLERAVRVAPRYGAAHYELALAYRDAGRDADSRREMSLYEADRNAAPPDDPLTARVSALRIDATTRLARAAEMERRGDLQGALREHLAALEEEPGFAQAHINLISIYARLGDTAKAREHGEKALAAAPERAELHYNLGVLDAGQGRLREAETSFRKAVELNPDYASALTNLGQVLETRRRYAEATALYRRAIASRPDYPLARFHLGRMLLGEKKPAEAVTELRAALEPERPQTAEVWMGLFAAHAMLGRNDEARQAAERAKSVAVRYGRQDLAQAIDRELERLH